MNDEPEKTNEKFPHIPIGVIYSRDEQCVLSTARKGSLTLHLVTSIKRTLIQVKTWNPTEHAEILQSATIFTVSLPMDAKL